MQSACCPMQESALHAVRSEFPFLPVGDYRSLRADKYTVMGFHKSPTLSPGIKPSTTITNEPENRINCLSPPHLFLLFTGNSPALRLPLDAFSEKKLRCGSVHD